MPEPLGSSINITAFVDANHAGNVVTRRSYTGIIIYLQNTPIVWHSRHQNIVETSTFGSEFVALRCARDLIVALRCVTSFECLVYLLKDLPKCYVIIKAW
jgi:hypothetical protein